MSWEDVYNLLESVGGKIECLLPERIEAATAEGPGDAATQIAVAQAEYARHERKLKRKEAQDGQKRLHFA